MEERTCLVDDALAIARMRKQAGSTAYMRADVDEASSLYSRAQRILCSPNLRTDERFKVWRWRSHACIARAASDAPAVVVWCARRCDAAALAFAQWQPSHRTAPHRTVRRMQFVLQAEIASLSTSCSLNLAQCELKRGNAPAVVAHCTAVLEADKLCTKAWFRRAHAYLKLSELDLALADCTQALALETGRP